MQYGLIGAGPVHKYLVSSLPKLGKELGLVAAINRRTASRIVNTLRAGAPCEIDAFGATSLILICAPGEHLKPLLAALERKQMEWRGKSLVLCGCSAFSRELDSLRSSGASVASLRNMIGLPRRCLVEGDREALRAARYLVQQLGCISVEIRPEDYIFYAASATFASSLFTPLLEGCMSAMRRTKLSGAHSGQIVEALFLNSLRSFMYSGRKSWAGVAADGDQAAMNREMNALASLEPAFEEAYRKYAEAATGLLGPRRRIRKRSEKV